MFTSVAETVWHLFVQGKFLQDTRASAFPSPAASDSQGTFSSLQQQRHISVSKGAQPEPLERELNQCGHGMLYWAPVTSESLGMAM